MIRASALAALGDQSGIGDGVIRWTISFEGAGELTADLDQTLAVIS